MRRSKAQAQISEAISYNFFFWKGGRGGGALCLQPPTNPQPIIPGPKIPRRENPKEEKDTWAARSNPLPGH